MKKSKDQACQRIYTRCPACHNDTLIITKTGRLLCTWHVCPNPILIDRIGEPSYVLLGVNRDKLQYRLEKWKAERSNKQREMLILKTEVETLELSRSRELKSTFEF